MSAKSGGRRGQALVEYSVILFGLIAALFVAPLVRLPAPGTSRYTTVAKMLFDAYQIYNDGYFFMLCSPLY